MSIIADLPPYGMIVAYWALQFLNQNHMASQIQDTVKCFARRQYLRDTKFDHICLQIKQEDSCRYRLSYGRAPDNAHTGSCWAQYSVEFTSNGIAFDMCVNRHDIIRQTPRNGSTKLRVLTQVTSIIKQTTCIESYCMLHTYEVEQNRVGPPLLTGLLSQL